MNLFVDSFWRALAYCLHPRIIALSFVPLLLMLVLCGAVIYYFWEPALLGLREWLPHWALLEGLLRWLDRMGLADLRSVLAPLLLLLLTLPLVVVLSLLAVSWLMTPSMVTLVAQRRFAALERRHGGSFWHSVLLGLGLSVLAAVALAVSMPLWLIPPLVMVLPPLIWGWLTYRVMVYDVLAEHASRQERAQIVRRHRFWLLAVGVLTAYLGAAPGMVWAIGAMAIVLAPLLVPLAIWIHTFVFAFSALWFSHFCLAALADLRDESSRPPVMTRPVSVPEATALALQDESTPDNRSPA